MNFHTKGRSFEHIYKLLFTLCEVGCFLRSYQCYSIAEEKLNMTTIILTFLTFLAFLMSLTSDRISRGSIAAINMMAHSMRSLLTNSLWYTVLTDLEVNNKVGL